MPIFLSFPAAAWLLPAVALPIIFHLFFRLRRQVREFPSLMFFLRIDPRLSAKRKIHEWLILFLRCLFLALLILALARPIFGNLSAGGNVARLILIDNSGSMAAASTSGVPKMNLAERAAATLLAAAHPGDVAAVQVMLPDPTASLPRDFDATPAVLRDAIGKLTPSDGAAPVAKAIRLALATLDTAKPTQRELHIITDLQHKNWSRGDLGAEATNCRIIVHRIESAPVTGGSVSLEIADYPHRTIPAGRVTPVRVTLQNNGAGAGQVRLNSTDDSGRNFSRDVTLPAGATSSIVLTFTFPNPGFHWARIWLEGDMAPSADRASLGFSCTDARKVLFLGAKEDFGAMPFAVAPGGNADLSGIDAVYGDASQLTAKPLAAAITWASLAQGDSGLQDYVRQGGTLFVLPSPDTGVAIGKTAPPWLGANAGTLLKATDPEPVILLREGDPLWQDLRDSDGRPKLGGLRAFQYEPLTIGSDWQGLITSAKGAPLLARRPLDRGQIFASGLAFTPRWSSLPLKAGFVVLMQNAVFGAQTENLSVQEIHAGDDFRFDLPDAPAAVKSLAGSALDWHGDARDFAGFVHAGVFEIHQRERIAWLSVSGNVDEADPHFLPLASVPLLHNLPHDVVPLVHEDDITHLGSAPASGASLFRWLLLVALLILLLETWLANERSSDLGRKLFGSLKATPPKSNAPKPERELARK